MNEFDKHHFVKLMTAANAANIAFQAFGEYLREKYNLPEGTQITPNGDIVAPKVDEGNGKS